jgi:hypothetical protein
MFAPAPSHGFCLRDFHLLWRKAGSFVRSIAKRLGLGPTAGTPPVGAGFGFQNERRLLRNDGFAHLYPFDREGNPSVFDRGG